MQRLTGMEKVQRSSLENLEEPTAVELQIMRAKTGKGLELQRPTKTFSDTRLSSKDQSKGDTLASKPIVSVSFKFIARKLREGCMEMKEERKKSVLRIMSRKELEMWLLIRSKWAEAYWVFKKIILPN